MKKIILTLAAVFAFAFANAQEVTVSEGNGFSKGNKFVEGAFSIQSGTTSQAPGDSKTAYKFNPKFGYMVTDQWALGADLDVSGNKFYGENVYGSNKNTTFGIGAFARYNFLTLGATKSFNAYAEAGLGYSGTRGEDAAGNETEKYNGMKFNIDLGINYFFTNHWAASFELANIVSYNTLTQNGESTNGLNVSVNEFNNIFAQPTFGLLYKW
jgi:hypothetical protein